jgi:hypothetical protein
LDAQFYVLSPEGIGGHWPFLFSFLFLLWLLLWLWIGRCRSQNGIFYRTIYLVSQTLGFWGLFLGIVSTKALFIFTRMLDDAFDVFPIDTAVLIVVNLLRALVGGVLLRCPDRSPLLFIVRKGGLASWWTFGSLNVEEASVLVPVIFQSPTITYR